MEQLSLFNEPPLKIHNKVRLIELFSGIGAQAKAMERLGVDFEHWRSYDFDRFAVASYNAVHGTDFGIGDVTKIHAADLGIENREEFTYLLTPSLVRIFPLVALVMAWRRGAVQEVDSCGKSKEFFRNAVTICHRSLSWRTWIRS